MGIPVSLLHHLVSEFPCVALGWACSVLPDTLQRFIPMFLHPRSRLVDGHSVDSRRSVVTLDPLEGLVQGLPSQAILQQITSSASFLLSRVLMLCAPAYSLRSTQSLCRQPFRYSVFNTPASFQLLLKIYDCSALPETTVLWPLLTSHGKLYSVFRIGPNPRP